MSRLEQAFRTRRADACNTPSYLFVSSSHAAEILNLVKSFHDLLPYAAMKLGLSLVNPTLAIKAIVQILLGQPAGQPSLFQRYLSESRDTLATRS